MNLDERPFDERLHSEVQRIPLPPRERWTPRERSRPRFISVMATLALLALVAVVAAPIIQELRARTSEVGSGSSPVPSSPGATPSTCGPLDPTGPAACLIAGTLVEIVGHDGGLRASTALARVLLDDTSLSAQFGNPTLFETDAHTQIEPSAPTVAATGVKVGARVMVAFDGRAPKTSSGAYLLVRFVVVSSG